MNRRESIRNILIASAGTAMLAGCTEENAIKFLKEDKLLLNKRHLDYIGAIADTFLPLESIKGKIDKPVDYIMAMINDCHSPEDINQFAIGFDQYKLLMKENKLKIKKSDKTNILSLVEKSLRETEPRPEMIHFINKVKSLAIGHLKNSQYYMEEYREYKLIPESYNGCIDA